MASNDSGWSFISQRSKSGTTSLNFPSVNIRQHKKKKHVSWPDLLSAMSMNISGFDLLSTSEGHTQQVEESTLTFRRDGA